jgi:tetratricopeptide (TPR) repeat protein
MTRRQLIDWLARATHRYPDVLTETIRSRTGRFRGLIAVFLRWEKDPMSTYSHLDNTKLPNFDGLWDYGKPQETEAKFRELLPRAREEGSADYVAQLLTQLARTRGLQQDFAEAHELLDQVEPMLTDEMPVARARYLLERGRAFNSSKQPEQAQPLFLESWEVSRRAKADFHAVDAAHMLALVAEPARKMEWNLKAAEVAEQSDDQRARGWLSALYNNIGWDHFAEKRYQEALATFQKGVVFSREQKRDNWIRVSRWSVAKTLRMLGKVEEALGIQRELDREEDASGAERSGYTWEELGECLYALGEADEAKKYFALAYQRLSNDQWLQRDEPERLERLKKLGGVK